MSGPVTVALVDNHEVVQRGIAAIIATVPQEFVCVGAYTDPGPLLDDPDRCPAVVVLDLWLGRDDADSGWAIEPLRQAGASVLLHTTEERPVRLRSAVQAGALGLALKSDGADAFLDVLRGVAMGEFGCTSELASALLADGGRAARLAPREVDVLTSLADGLTRDQVAARLGISEGTVKTHLMRTREKYLALGRDVTNSTSLVVEAHRDGYGTSPHL
ncbi:LuxR C-terminal-related transcriptional regulator [Janibacter sp. RAF20_2_2]|uniref:LuxR C-terminal-related transcriptional regulator n=1 Tax=unclassified Janibacter TaxID=2649294 RepID=UPI003F931BC2